MNFPLRVAFPVSHRFWVVVFSFSFVSRYLLISLLISLTHSSFNNMLFSFYVFRYFSVFFLWLMSSFIAFGVREDAWYDFSLLKFIETCFVSWRVVCPRKHSMCTWKVLWGEMLWRYQLNPFDLGCHLRLLSPCSFSALKIYPWKSMVC